MNVIIIHGWAYSPPGHWQQWLRDELKKRGVDAEMPTLPNYNDPKQSEWLEAMNKLKIDENTIVVAHSLGCVATLRFLEQGKRAGSVILVSGFLHGPGNREFPDCGFFEKPLDWQKIRKNAKEFMLINSDNDFKYGPSLHEAELISKGLGINAIIEPGLGHINMSSGHGPYPRVLNLVLERLNK